MKNLIVDPFTCLLPTLDLHGLNSFEATVKVKEFINDNIKLKNEKVVIIHGKGTGILKNVVHNLLKSNKYVLNYYIYNLNDGMTIVLLTKELD